MLLLPSKPGFSVCPETNQTPERSEHECVGEILNSENVNSSEEENHQNKVNKNRKNKVKRGNKKRKDAGLNIMSTNAAQLKGKLNSFKSELKSCNAGVFTVQETHYATKGKLQIENFENFEAIRKKVKGGWMIGVHKGLKPFLIEE